MIYEVRSAMCNCHPETCCCYEYVIVTKAAENKRSVFGVVARGSDKAALDALVKAANKAANAGA